MYCIDSNCHQNQKEKKKKRKERKKERKKEREKISSIDWLIDFSLIDDFWQSNHISFILNDNKFI